MIGSVWVPVLATGRTECRLWPPPPAGEAADLAVGVHFMVCMLLGCTGLFTANSLISCMLSSLVGQFGVVGVWLQTAQTSADLRRAIVLHQKVSGLGFWPHALKPK